ncbi:hypothetical protein [Acinetobacter sp.]|uniref:hypothetical protein n=1 Tax=Acinetobacter sp. TaxID=472 RepID=UPI00389053A0
MKNSDFRLPFNDLTNYVPQNLRNPVITGLIDNLFNRFLTHDESVPLYGYVGRKPASPDDRAPRVPQSSVERDINSIIPVFNFKLGSERHAFTVEDLIRKAEAIGISTENLQWLYSQGNNFLPPIDLDKFTNFFNYYWVAKAIPAVPNMPWNPDLVPEYYTIAAPLPSDVNKLNVIAASTTNTVLTGSGFNKLSFKVLFTSPTEFTITPVGSLGVYSPVNTKFKLETESDHVQYLVKAKEHTVKLVEFDITRDQIYDQYGNAIGLAGFVAGDQFIISVEFLTRNYTVNFTGASGVKGKITRVKSLNEYQSIDGVKLRAGDRVLIKNNSVIDDGIYVVSPGNWERARDFDETTQGPGARVYDNNRNIMYVSIEGGGGFGFEREIEPIDGYVSNTNQWQEGNFWVSGDELANMGLARADVIQAVRPIIEYTGDVQLNSFVKNGRPSDSGTPYRQLKTEFGQLPLFDLYRYDGTHAGLVSSVFYYEEDLTASVDLKLQRRVKMSTNDSADFIFNHGMADENGQLLFIKRNNELKSIWHAGYDKPTIVDVKYEGEGNGTLEKLEAKGFTQQQVWSLTAVSDSSFEIKGSKTPVLPSPLNIATVGEAYSNGELSFTIKAGNASFKIGDTFVFRVANLETPRYVYRDKSDNIFDRFGGPTLDLNGEGTWQIPRTFYNNPYNESRAPVAEGVLYSHFRGILSNQLPDQPIDYSFGGSIKLWSEQQTLLMSLLMQKDMTPISIIDLAQRQYETALNSIRDIYEQNIVQYELQNGSVTTYEELNDLLDYILRIRARDNAVRTVLYDTTSPVIGFPATLPQLGMAELVKPIVRFDTALGITVLVHHDGHESTLFNDVMLNSLMLLVETRLYEGINPNARKYSFDELKNDPKFTEQVKKELFAYAAMNGLDPLASDYVASDPFTWNYSKATVAQLPVMPAGYTPARWFALLKAHQSMIPGVIPTERPNLEPWKLMGFETHDAWWLSLTPEKRTAYTSYAKREDFPNTPVRVMAVQTQREVTPLQGITEIDGVSLGNGNIVLLQNQVSAANNGLWIVSANGWTRAPAADLVTITSGSYKGSVWVRTAGQSFKQVRDWSNQLWVDIKDARPELRLSVNTRTDELFPPYVNAQHPLASDALVNHIPPGASLGYDFGENSPVETMWRKSIGFRYSLARALFRYDPLAFLGFAWGFNWVEVDGILYDGVDMNMPGHKRFRLHGDQLNLVERSPLSVTGSGNAVLTYNAYSVRDGRRIQNFEVKQGDMTLGYVDEGEPTKIGGMSFTIHDEGKPFRIGDRFEITNGTTIFVPASTHIYLGFGQVFTHALRETSIDTSSSFAVSAFREWEVNMGYRAGGLVATDDLQVYTESETLSVSAFDLLFKRNEIARNEWVQALRISLINFEESKTIENSLVPIDDGKDWVFRIEGYNPRHTAISYYSMSQEAIDFNALGGAHTNLVWYQPTQIDRTVTTNLPLTITGIQNVVNFLFGYSNYLESRGWEFNKDSEFNIDAETGRKRNFQLEIEKFIDRCYAGLNIGQGHVVNPFIERAWFNQRTGLVSEFIDTPLFDITGHPGAFDMLGVKFKKTDLDVIRGNDQSSFGATAPMFSAHVQLDEFEHLFIFNNYAQPSIGSGLLYDAFSGARVATYKFNGRKQATSTMRPEFGGHFLVGNEVHQNLQAMTDNVANLYDSNHAFENETTTRHALALLGFNRKQYFDDLDISEKTQFNFWRGLIQAKGTNLSIDAYLNNNRFEDAKIDEYWAYKLAEYGDARQNTFPELKLSVNDALTQFTRLQFDNDSLADAGFDRVDVINESRWFSIDDMNQDVSFGAEDVGSFTITDAVPGKLYELPFVADALVPGSFTQINATTIKSTITSSIKNPLVILGKGPARPRFNPVKLFNYVDNELVAEIPMWHPAAGQHTPSAIESINIISDINPARYNYSKQVANNNTYDPLRPWGATEVGRVWFDTRNLAYLPYYDANIFGLDERLSRWGTLADFASIDVYEWVQSSVPPTEYDALAAEQAGDAELDPLTKAAGQVADKQTYSRVRSWKMRPVAWSYSPVPADVDWGATPPFPGGSTNAQLVISNGLAILNKGTFADYGIQAGMHLGAWNNDEANPKPLSEYFIENKFTKSLRMHNQEFVPQTHGSFEVDVEALGTSTFAGELDFFSTNIEIVPNPYDETSTAISYLKVIKADSGEVEVAVVAQQIVANDAGPNIAMIAGQKILVDVPGVGIRIKVTSLQAGVFPIENLGAAIEAVLGSDLVVHDAVVITPIVPSIDVDLSNDLQDNDERYGWRVWNVPSQEQLNADGLPPVSSWKPYYGDFVPISGNLTEIQNGVAYAKTPLTLRNMETVDRYQTTWSDWILLQNIKLEATQTNVTGGPVIFNSEENLDSTRVSVYVNGISQLKAAFTIAGKVLTVASVNYGSKVTVIIRKYEPTLDELKFDPDSKDDLSLQKQFKQDYEYVALPVRDSDGSLSSNVYFFWVKNKTTPAIGKKQSVQTIAQQLRDGPLNFLTFQNLKNDNGKNYRYDAITISGLSYIVTKDNTFKLRFTRNFTLRDDPEELNLKNVHTEWALMRPGQKTRVPENLWRKLTDSVVGLDAAGNRVPSIRRVLYDERNGTQTSYGFGPEQTLAPAELLRSSIIHTILNTALIDENAKTVVPDYIAFLNFDESQEWFKDESAARKTMTDIWNQAKISQVNEIFFAALNDIIASNYELSDIFKTSRLSAYSIKVIMNSPVAPTYE